MLVWPKMDSMSGKPAGLPFLRRERARTVAFAASITIGLLLLASCGSTPTSATAPAPSTAPVSNICGVLAAGLSGPAVVNGTQCSAASSSVVQVNIRSSSGDVLFPCTGTILDSRAVLTAGHCVANQTAATVALGNGTEVAAVSAQIAPGYSPGSSTSQDVAVIFTGQDLGLAPFELLDSRDAAVGERAVIAGVGKDQSGNYPPAATLKVGGTNISAVGAFFLQTALDGSGNGSGACTGDSGGPLLVFQRSRWVVAGVASSISGSNCNSGSTFYVNLRNADVKAFIRSVVPGVGLR